nr:MAG TPA: hypothetical protein [Caudoviricetes sp.]
MSENLVLTENDLKGIQNAILHGVANQEQVAQLSRIVSVAIVSDLVEGTKTLKSTISPLIDLQRTIFSKLQERIEVDIDTMELKDILELSKFLHNSQMSVLELERKIAQGKNLFESVPTITEEERNVLRMLKSFQTEEERMIFYETLKSALGLNKVKQDKTSEVPEDKANDTKSDDTNSGSNSANESTNDEGDDFE